MTPGLSQRQREFLTMLTEDAGRSVSELSRVLGVSTVTLRNDLSSLAGRGLIVRTHGGALPAFRPGILENGAEPEARRTSPIPAAPVKPVWLNKAGPNLARTAQLQVPQGGLLNDGHGTVYEPAF